MRALRIALITSVLLALTLSSALAELKICNRTNKSVDIAVMFNNAKDVWVSRGWYVVQPGSCATPIGGDLDNRYYYYYARRSDNIAWYGGEKSAAGCVVNVAFETAEDADCQRLGEGGQQQKFRMLDVGNSKSYRVNLTKDDETTNFRDPQNVGKACAIISSNLQRPMLRSERITVGWYTDPLTVPQTKSECTNIRDTGVPDPARCRVVTDNCASKWTGPFGTWGCIPGATTECDGNIKVCDTYANYKKVMQCTIYFQIKLPNYIESSIEEFLDNNFNVISRVQGSLPLQCASADVRSTAEQTGSNIARAAADAMVRIVRQRIEDEIRRWLQETAIQTIAASIPSGGTGGAAVMATRLATFVRRVHAVIEPIVRTAKDVSNFAEDIGFSTSCGWSDWSRW